MSTVRSILREIQPGWLRALRRSMHNYRVLNFQMGQFRTMRLQTCLGPTGEPIPWFTYPAIEFLNQLDLSRCSIFEYGSGASTLFWAKRARTVVSVEDNPTWHGKLRTQLPPNVQYRFAQSQRDFVEAIQSQSAQFQIIVVDGSCRYDCAVIARQKLHPEGFMILDNSDWMPKTSKYLRDSGLIQIDMSGFGPINGYTWTTSFFLSREFSLPPRGPCQPLAPAGSAPSPPNIE